MTKINKIQNQNSLCNFNLLATPLLKFFLIGNSNTKLEKTIWLENKEMRQGGHSLKPIDPDIDMH